MPEKCIKDYVAPAAASVAHQPPNQTKLIKMKSMFVVALALVAVVAAAPAAEAPEEILRSNFEQQAEGSYAFDFETAKGIVRQEEGQVKEVLDEENKPHNVVIVRGSYSYPGEDGKPVTITFVADELGFHPEGDSIPKPARR